MASASGDESDEEDDDFSSSDDEDDYSWIGWFCSRKGHEFLCTVSRFATVLTFLRLGTFDSKFDCRLTENLLKIISIFMDLERSFHIIMKPWMLSLISKEWAMHLMKRRRYPLQCPR